MADAAPILDGPYQPPLPLELGPADPMPPTPQRSPPVFSGERVARDDPERYRLFCALFFASGLGQMEICRTLSMSPQTGAAIIAREQASMSAEKLRAVQASRARSVVTLALSAIQERLTDPDALAEIPLRDLAHAMQRAHEVGAMLAGDPTHRVERVDATRPDDAARDYLASLPAADVRLSPPEESIRTGEKDEDRESGQAAGCAAGCKREAPGEDVEGARVDGSAGAFGDSESPAANAQKAMGTGARDDVAGESYAQSYAVGGAVAGPAVSVGAGGRSVEGAR